MHLGSDRRTIEAAYKSLPIGSPDDLRVAWIRNTLALEHFFVSESVLREPGIAEVLEPVSSSRVLSFDECGNIDNLFAQRDGI
jgi:hypothetical protein